MQVVALAKPSVTNPSVTRCTPMFDVFSSRRGNHEAASAKMKRCENEIEDTKAPDVLSPDPLDHDKVAAVAKLCHRVALCV